MCRTALRATAVDKRGSILAVQRDIIDFADRMSPDFAAELISLVDDDPARAAAKNSLNERMHVLSAKRQMQDVKSTSVPPEADRPQRYVEAAWLSLGEMNAGRSTPVQLQLLRSYVRVASSLSMSEGYPIIAWVLGNVIRRQVPIEEATRLLRPIFASTLLACNICSRMSARASILTARVSEASALAGTTRGTIIVREGERIQALTYLRRWLTEDASEYLKICDPFFGSEDLDILRLVLECNPRLRVQVLTSVKHQMQEGVLPPYSESFGSYWRASVLSQDPPDTEIAIVGRSNDNDLPIHDRWWISQGTGLRVGTSFRSLGHGKVSEISLLSPDEAAEKQSVLDLYILRQAREHQGQKLKYMVFTL